MKKEELGALIDGFRRNLPERMTGNEENSILAARIAGLVQTERSGLVELLRDWLSIRIPQSERTPGDGVREGRMWLALEVAKKYGLSELRSDTELLIADVRSGKTFLPYYADMIAKYLRGIP
jgi:hypothetical protein